MMEGFSSVQVDRLSVLKCKGTAPLMIAGDSLVGADVTKLTSVFPVLTMRGPHPPTRRGCRRRRCSCPRLPHEKLVWWHHKPPEPHCPWRRGFPLAASGLCLGPSSLSAHGFVELARVQGP